MGARYIDLSDRARGMLRDMAARFVEASALIVRDEIQELMETSSPRTGRTYLVPGTRTRYVASAPGEPPAIREGRYAQAWALTPAVWQGTRARSFVYNPTRAGPYFLWRLLEEGTSDLVNFHVRMAPRPHVVRGIDRARPRIEALSDRISRR